ncbi:cytochrome-c oxidase, cbb3-type subunit III [Motilimonas pumila]|uniref:Cbb3-type cytochrome c oxidase subunit n=1 Tax=Motilimonas pumila TaxID=2303987 RepID=A0A418YB26_9GAMM|nr:cytochrome-c oxidase, cbb3-type subunit III [Motilimonas pumila]RJG40153.1 cytochrome-c oxidase, cbb3-type subunit III [Motilimonas pumila]
MSTFWSVWITVITLIVIFGCAILLYWCAKDKMGVEEGKSMGHSFDGIEELNTDLPKWWVGLFAFTIVGSLIYVLLFPSFGGFGNGLLGWTSADYDITSKAESVERAKESNSQYQREVNAAEEKYGEVFKALAYGDDGKYLPIEEISHNPEAVKVGQRLFLQNCAQCHGSDAKGATGFPNLTDNDWLYGGSGDKIKETLMEGRVGLMPVRGLLSEEQLAGEGMQNLVSYVLSLSGRKVNAIEAQKGKELFGACMACHGVDGKGNQALGAPNLTDNIWLYGGSRKAVEATLRHGRNGVMPAWKDILGEDKIQIISAYVYSLSNEKE